jgi:hypothetical protein
LSELRTRTQIVDSMGKKERLCGVFRRRSARELTVADIRERGIRVGYKGVGWGVDAARRLAAWQQSRHKELVENVLEQVTKSRIYESAPPVRGIG